MTEYLPAILAALAVGACWYCYLWGRADGKEEGYLSGNAVGRSDSRTADAVESCGSKSGIQT